MNANSECEIIMSHFTFYNHYLLGFFQENFNGFFGEAFKLVMFDRVLINGVSPDHHHTSRAQVIFNQVGPLVATNVTNLWQK